MIPKVKVGSIWAAGNMQTFLVTDVVEKNNQVWVYYQRRSDASQKYHCLEPAFVHRFTEYSNEG